MEGSSRRRASSAPRLPRKRAQDLERRRPRHEGNPNPPEGNPNFSERNPSGSGTNSKSGGTKSKFTSSAFLRFIKDLRKTDTAFFIFGSIPASKGSRQCRRCVFAPSCSILRSSFSVPPIFFKQVKGWRHFFDRGWRLCETRGRGFRPTPRPRSLVAPEGEPQRPRIPGVMSPGTEDPRIKTGRSIRCAAKNAPLEMSPIRCRAFQADGRQPFMPANISQPLPLILIPSVAPMRGGCGRFPSGALRAPFTQRKFILARFRYYVKKIQQKGFLRKG